MTRTLCAVTGSRAEYGIQKFLYKAINAEESFQLNLVVTGSHLSSKYGQTINEITDDGFTVSHCIDLSSKDTDIVSVADSLGKGVAKFSAYFAQTRPDIVMVLGDRFEIFAAVTAAYMQRIPVVHLHGGETTEGAYDEAFRHAITKMSQLHFVATEPYRKRVVQLGEHPETVFNVGSLAVDNISRMTLLTKQEVEDKLGITLMERSLLITYHPETLSSDLPATRIRDLLVALSSLEDTTLIFTMPNADTGSDEIRVLLEEFTNSQSNAFLYASLGQLLYYSCLKLVDGVVGNSSSGLIEVPSFGIGTVNIGDRQKGRIKADSVIDCEPGSASIQSAIELLFDDAHRQKARNTVNPYERKDTTKNIVKILREKAIFNLKKSFFDIDFDLRSLV